MVFHQGLQCLKYQYMMTQAERECVKTRRTGDDKCVSISKALDVQSCLSLRWSHIGYKVPLSCACLNNWYGMIG